MLWDSLLIQEELKETERQRRRRVYFYCLSFNGPTFHQQQSLIYDLYVSINHKCVMGSQPFYSPGEFQSQATGGAIDKVSPSHHHYLQTRHVHLN